MNNANALSMQFRIIFKTVCNSSLHTATGSSSVCKTRLRDSNVQVGIQICIEMFTEYLVTGKGVDG